MITPEQVADYVEGTTLMKLHQWGVVSSKLVEQRMELAKECYLNGECLHCGCKTPDLFYASRGCEKSEPCYEATDSTLLYKITLKIATWIGIERLNILVKFLKIKM